LADGADGEGVIKFEDCNFKDWDIEMHYGINVAVKVKSFQILNTKFENIKMLPLWHTINVKEAS